MKRIHSTPTEISHPVEAEPIIDADIWENFWENAVNGTLFHSLKFMSYHPADRFKQHHLGFKRKGNLVGIFLSAERDEDGVKTWVSHPGASYGGPAWSKGLRYHHLESLITALVEYAKTQNFGRIRMTPPPAIYNLIPEETLRFALMRHGFKIVRSELTQAVKLDFDEDQLIDQMVNKTRTAYRKAVKEGLQFRIIEKPTQAEFDRFNEILVENRAGLGVVPAHSREEIEKLHNLVPDKLMMAVIEHHGRMVSVIWNFICNKSTVLEFYMAHIADAQILRPVTFLTYHTLLWAKRKGFKWLDFGISSIDGEPTWGLMKYKENFQAKHFMRLTYQLDL
ncbi:GNAT family N-acetyltransferase [bacterium]|nr:GNAT family N-acetyltransferase [bacterium]